MKIPWNRDDQVEYNKVYCHNYNAQLDIFTYINMYMPGCNLLKNLIKDISIDEKRQKNTLLSIYTID